MTPVSSAQIAQATSRVLASAGLLPRSPDRFSVAPPETFPPHTIMVARPLSEMASHISHRMRPSWQLIARCIKVIALALFRGHFCDHVFLSTGTPREERNDSTTPNWRNTTSVLYNFSGPRISSNVVSFAAIYPFMFERAIELRVDPSRYPEGPPIISLDSQLWEVTRDVTVRDLLQSPHLLKLNA